MYLVLRATAWLLYRVFLSECTCKSVSINILCTTTATTYNRGNDRMNQASIFIKFHLLHQHFCSKWYKGIQNINSKMTVILYKNKILTHTYMQIGKIRLLHMIYSWNSTGKIGRIGRHRAETHRHFNIRFFGPMPPDAFDFPGGIPA